ncbi:hypothetical protein B0H19DRAFT_1163957 [Neofusicoccum parvum]|uniref:Uncharacterized protein n=1 Tax=Neofusicoccum parvum TaxID=310453 RepID=A0ACB5SFA8_9PEZI|nr:hypothetical protein B0H19DRAFT_1163957 [Neofusicoccum parvum]
MSPLPTPGQTLLTLVALITSTGCFLADWNETHIHNPTWPAHAKFHNGQTMSFGALLGACTLWHIVTPPPSLPGNPAPHYAAADGHGAAGKSTADGVNARMWRDVRREARLGRLRTVVLLGGLYWVTQASGYFYPGSGAFDPIPGREDVEQDYWLQAKLEAAMFVMLGAGWWLERRRILAE